MPKVFNPKEDRQLIFIKTLKTAALNVDILSRDNKVLANLKKSAPLKLGMNNIVWNGRAADGKIMPEGSYKLRLATESDRLEFAIKIIHNREPLIRYSAVWPQRFTPNGSSPRRLQGIYFSLLEDGLVTVDIVHKKKVVRKLFSSKMTKGAIHEYWWDGKSDAGTVLKPGTYTARIRATNKKGTKFNRLRFKVAKTNEWRTDATVILEQLAVLLRQNKITRQEYADYRSAVVHTKSLISKFREKGQIQEWLDLGYVLHQVRRQKSKLVKRHYFLFNIFLVKNLTFYSNNKSPTGWTEFKDLDDTYIFVYYRNRGLQPHPVATLIRINSTVNDAAFIQSLDKLLKCTNAGYSASTGRAFETLLYQMEFLGGRSFWPSAMSQAKLLAALGRASKLTKDPVYSKKIRLVMNSFYVPFYEGGVLDSSRKGRWYLLYAYTNKYSVLNGHIVALQDLKKYADSTGDKEAHRLISDGFKELAGTVYKYDIKRKSSGWWSKYSLVSHPASDYYHTFNYLLLKWVTENTSDEYRNAILRFYARSWESSYIKMNSSPSSRASRAFTWPDSFQGRGLTDVDVEARALYQP